MIALALCDACGKPGAVPVSLDCSSYRLHPDCVDVLADLAAELDDERSK